MTQFPISKMSKEVWDYVSSRPIINFINYTINSKYRTSVRLSKWLKSQVVLPEKELDLCDKVMEDILYETKLDIRYKSDKSVWEMNEYWQTYTETKDLKTGDCEDGAIYMYIIARSKGVPANRLLLMCGDVVYNDTVSGHCWLAYRSDGNPFGFEFMDWCYYFNANRIPYRPRYEVIGKDIFGGNERYKKLWFAFNEDKSHSELQWSLKKI